jgi:hypothetical protein
VSAQFGYICSETGFQEQLGDGCSQPATQTFFFSDGVAKNIPHFFLHAAAMAFGSTLQARFNCIFNVPNHELSHRLTSLFYDIMLSHYPALFKVT